MSFVPIVFVPLNIMCSKKWLSPVIPGRSLAEPTRAVQPAAMVGESCCSYEQPPHAVGERVLLDRDLRLLGRDGGTAGHEGEKGEGRKAPGDVQFPGSHAWAPTGKPISPAGAEPAPGSTHLTPRRSDRYPRPDVRSALLAAFAALHAAGGIAAQEPEKEAPPPAVAEPALLPEKALPATPRSGSWARPRGRPP